jgi:hypothetical protein
MCNRILSLVAVVFAIGFSSMAQAQTFDSHTIAGCTVYSGNGANSADVAGDVIWTTDGLKNAGTGTVSVMCPIPDTGFNRSGNISAAYVYLYDGSTTASVKSRVMQVNIGTTPNGTLTQEDSSGTSSTGTESLSFGAVSAESMYKGVFISLPPNSIFYGIRYFYN